MDNKLFFQQMGNSGMNNASELHGDSVNMSAGQTVHQICQKEYVNKNVISCDLKEKTGGTNQQS